LMVLLGSLCLFGGWIARRLTAYPSLLPSGSNVARTNL